MTVRLFVLTSCSVPWDGERYDDHATADEIATFADFEPVWEFAAGDPEISSN